MALFITLLTVLPMLYIALLVGPADGQSSQCIGRFELTSDPADPAYGEYLTALGVSDSFRLVISQIKINIAVEQVQNDSYKISVLTPLVNRETTFKFGEEFTDKYVDGRSYKSTFVMEDENTIKQDLNFEDGTTGINRYKFSDDGLTATVTAKDKTAIRTYKRAG